MERKANIHNNRHLSRTIALTAGCEKGTSVGLRLLSVHWDDSSSPPPSVENREEVRRFTSCVRPSGLSLAQLLHQGDESDNVFGPLLGVLQARQERSDVPLHVSRGPSVRHRPMGETPLPDG